MSFGSCSQNCPQVDQAPHLAAGLPPVCESPRTWRRMSPCRRQEDTGCLAQCFQPACAKVSAAGGQKPSLTTGGFPAGLPSCLTPDINHSALSGTARVPFPYTDTAGTHTKELLKLPPAKSTGDKVAPPREQRQPCSVTTNLYKTQGLILHCSQQVPFVKVEPSPAS